MKILLYSYVFAPSVGGIESCSLALAREFVAAGHEVRIVTQTASRAAGDDHGFPVLRRPSRRELFCAVRWADVYFQNNVSLPALWPLLLLRRPWFVTTQTWLGRREDQPGWVGRLKRGALAWAQNLYISQAIARHVGHPGKVIGNPYDDQTFRLDPAVMRDRDVAFLGRLVSDKGCDLLLDALDALQREGREFTATIIGDGPERDALRAQAARLGLEHRVRFAGKLAGPALAAELNRHRILAVPSRWNEPFGIVVLEGMACGCVPVVSAGGGLMDATGGHGFTFMNGRCVELTRALAAAGAQAGPAPSSADHLRRHTARAIAGEYLSMFSREVPKRG